MLGKMCKQVFHSSNVFTWQVYPGGVSQDDDGDYHFVASQSLELPHGMNVHDGLKAASAGLGHAMNVIDYAIDPTFSAKPPPLKKLFGLGPSRDILQGEADLKASRSVTDQVRI